MSIKDRVTTARGVLLVGADRMFDLEQYADGRLRLVPKAVRPYNRAREKRVAREQIAKQMPPDLW